MIINSLIIVLEAVRIYLYMRCFHICIGKYKISRKIIITVFTALWIFESFILSLSHIGQGAALMEIFFLMVEWLVLLAVSFGYKGRIIWRLLLAVFLPVVYWVGNWSIVFILFSTVTSSSQYFIAAIIMVLLFGIFEVVLEKEGRSRQEREREALEREISIYENQFAVIKQSQQNIRSLKHDMKHHIKMLSDMIGKGESDAALDYLVSMGAFMENSEEYVVSGNEKIDSILNYMILKAKNLGIEIEWKIQIPEYLEISAFDINVILSNLLENALNALTDITEPILYILVKYDRGILCINTKNKYLKKDLATGSFQDYGIGLKNIRRIAEKYNGSLTTAIQNGIFYASVLLFLEAAE